MRGLDENDLVLALISGGGSALLAAPATGITLDEKRALTSRLLACGASIHEINCVRKHLSAIRAGGWRRRMAGAGADAGHFRCRRRRPEVIASGPTVADPTTCGEALAILDRYRLDVSAAVRRRLLDGALETPKPAIRASCAARSASLPARCWPFAGGGRGCARPASRRCFGDEIEGGRARWRRCWPV